jgi:hypothetical protein
MEYSEHCPRCGKGLVVVGSLNTAEGWLTFRPAELRLFSLSFQFPEVSVTNPAAEGSAAACASCGMVWAELDAATLRQKLHDLGNEDVRRRLSQLEGD